MGYQETFKALSDKTRREILTLLRAGPLSVGEIGEHFDISGATLPIILPFYGRPI